MKQRTIWLVPIFCCFLCISCHRASKEKKADESFQVIHPLVIDTVYTTEYVADIQSRQNVEIRARVKGYLEGVYADEGKHVKAGQKLFSISSQRYREELSRAKATLKSAIAEAKNAELQVKNASMLVDKKVISKTELDMEVSKLEAATANVEAARANEATAALSLSLTEIRAPFDGIINRIPYKTGSLINEETLLTSISDNREVFAYFNVSEREYLNYLARKKTGDKNEVSLVLADNQPFPVKGTIETVEGEFDKSTGNIAFRARFDNPDEVLKNGSSGKILLRRELKKVMIIPQKSTFEIQDKIYVFVVDKNKQVHMRNIVPAYRLQYLYVVASGLSSADELVYEGIQQVKEGDTIATRPALMRKLLAEKLH